MRRITGCLPLAAALLVLAGCGDDSGGGSEETAAPSAAASDQTEPESEGEGEGEDEPVADVACADGPPEAVVTDAGDEPRALMELTPTAGDSAATTMTMTMASSSTVDGEELPAAPVPPMTMGMVITVEDVTDDEITMTVVYDSAEIEGGDPTAQGLLDSMVGLTATVTSTRSGAFIDGGYDTEGLDPSLAPLLEQFETQLASLTVPLPTEPVGVGATWDVATSADLLGGTFCNVYGYTLTSFDGDAYEMTAEISQQGQPGPLEMGGASAELEELTGSGSGTTAGRLTFPVAISGNSDITTSTVISADGQNLEQQSEVQMELSPRD
ncbi:hypothetical protein [Jiangella muralis]|uniref:hypothetical protein n=1 Tax=Jiangella muralis TaxID=702383 RepID=UPI00069CCC51|nr:hypothetical protein [Jiangella muralis]